ncbi:MAG: hypothetical protein CL840_06380 [Crocinitomicaceae bacterium]|nr:hypothetical protein [Crocinitomicaceae bacterium]|tara:strand:- start:19206 stop:19859 length:654 start_codon:yes stop_codon:yes gene_type:complete
MLRLVLFTVLLGIYTNSNAAYTPYKLYEMIMQADVIVYGTISKVDSETFTLVIDGDVTAKRSIRVERFQDWTCARRWTEYKVGQRVFLFLKKRKRKLFIISSGGEGELPIINDSLYIHARSLSRSFLKSLTGEKSINAEFSTIYLHQLVNNEKFYGIKWSLDDFLISVQYIRYCFDIDEKTKNWITKCELKDIELKASQATLVDWIYQLSRQDKNGG